MGVQTSSEAFESMFRTHHDDLFRYAVRRVGPDSAPDVVAEVFLIAWRRRAEIPADAARLWLFGVASNRVMKEYRSATCITRGAPWIAVKLAQLEGGVRLRSLGSRATPKPERLRSTAPNG